jgi:hypothetical protein
VVHARVCVSLTHSTTGMRKARVRGPCVVTGRLTGAPSSFRDRLAALEVPCVPPGPLGRAPLGAFIRSASSSRK